MVRSFASWRRMPTIAGLVLLAVLAARGSADSYQVLYNFAGGTSDGQYPTGSLILSGTTLYGVTEEGGTADDGTVFSYNLATNSENVLHSFTGATTDGKLPIGPLVLSGSTLYGVTNGGGSAGEGTVFSVNTANDNETLLHSFTGSPTDGSYPQCSLTQVGSFIYGATLEGGATNSGTIFGFNSSVYNGVSTLHSFSGGSADGFGMPVGNLAASGSTIYGLSQTGGGNGDVFAYNTNSGGVSVVSYFNGNDGQQPISLFESTQSSSIFYGMTQLGGSEDAGVIFELNTANDTETPLLSFGTAETDAGSPVGLVQSDNILYGITSEGGIQGGEIFSFDLTTGDYTILHSFLGGTGVDPQGGLLLDGSTLYGVAQGGGVHDDGVIFSYAIPEPGTLTLLIGVGGCLLFRRKRRSRCE
jgi:uncharacterized repeat protein (TIGR03803 family)